MMYEGEAEMHKILGTVVQTREALEGDAVYLQLIPLLKQGRYTLGLPCCCSA